MLCNLIDKCGRRLLGFRVLELISFDSLGHLACETTSGKHKVLCDRKF